MRGPFTRAGEIFNYAEVALWPALGVAVAVLALRRNGRARAHGLVAAITLFAFGASDWAENATGGEWWTPWWLLVWKTFCVIVLLTLALLSRQPKRRVPH